MPPDTSPLPRRRVLRLAGLALAGAAIAVWPRRPEPITWTGQAMGGPASLTLHGVAAADARRLIGQVVALVDAMENLFSLHRPDSALSRLNREGVLSTAPVEFTDLLGRALAMAAATDGAFDPTVQPLWDLYRTGDAPDDAVTATRARLGWQRVGMADDRIALPPGMGLTLNGIAQGYITDKVVGLLATQGIGHMLVDMGEPRGMGRREDGTDWHLGIADPADATQLLATVPVSGRALATSAPRATLADANGRYGHIFDAATGRPATGWAQVSVAAADATHADALSTAIAAAPVERAQALLKAGGGKRAWLLSATGDWRVIDGT